MHRKREKAKSRVQKRRSDSRSSKAKSILPRNLEEFFALSKGIQNRLTNSVQAVTEMRKDISLTQAARKFHIAPSTLQRLAAPALRKLKSGRYSAKKRDSLFRVLVRLANDGVHEIGTNDSKQASLLGNYWNAVEIYQTTGNDSALRKFDGQHVIDSSGEKFAFLTDTKTLDRLGSAGVLSFESLYGRAA
jgi:hypothetical protein